MTAPLYNSKPERELQTYLRAHCKAKYKCIKRAAFVLGMKQNTIYDVLNGRRRAPKKLLDDAGVVVEKTITWEVVK